MPPPRKPSDALYDELWARLASVVRQIAAVIADGIIEPDVDELEERLSEFVDWSTDADEYLREVEYATRQEDELQRLDFSDLDEEAAGEPDDEERELQVALSGLREAIRDRNVTNLRTLFDELYAAIETVNPQFDAIFERTDQVISLLEIKTPTLLYLPPPPKLYIPQLLIESNAFLIKELARAPRLLHEITPRKFEEIMADIFWKAGYEVELTMQTRDGGRDIIALSRRMDIPLRLIIECKRYAPHHKVGLALVQRLFGVKIAEKANKAILATTSTFTRDAREFASSHIWDLDLKDHDAIVKWLRRYPNIIA